MAELDLRGVHVFTKVQGSAGMFRLTKTNPYLRIANNIGTLYLQSGQVFSEEQGPVKEIPEWFLQELAKANPAVIKECGGLPQGVKLK